MGRSWTQLRGLYRAGARPHFDDAAVHPFAREIRFVNRILRYNRTVMRQHGDARKPLIISELNAAYLWAQLQRAQAITDKRLEVIDEATWMGHSIGKWEGETLVVHTTGFNGKSWLDRVGHPYSEELQLTERFRRMDNETLQVDITFHDPKTYTRDWTGQKIFRLRPTWELKEYVCEDNYTFDDFQTETGVKFIP